MKLSAASSTLKQLRKSPWKFQQTFKTPLKRLEPFVATIVSTGLPQTASVTIEQAVFEPKHWINLLTRYSLPPKYGKGISVIATGQSEIQELLHAVFADSVDFLFVPNPKRFVIYADHDEYTTFFVNTRSHINRIAESLLAQGFEEIARYTRSYRLPEKPGRFLREHGFYSAVSTGGHEYPLRIPQAVSSRVTTPIPISH